MKTSMYLNMMVMRSVSCQLSEVIDMTEMTKYYDKHLLARNQKAKMTNVPFCKVTNKSKNENHLCYYGTLGLLVCSRSKVILAQELV